MESLFRYVASPTPCGYLPGQMWSLEYEYVAAMTAGEYLGRLLDNWRRFGTMLFRPACRSCTACRSLRVVVERFRPDRSQRRCRQANEGVVELRIGPPSVNRTKLALYDRYHTHQADAKGWPRHPPRDAASYADSFVNQPFPVEEWCYYLDDQLIGVGYVDPLPGPLTPNPSPPEGRGEKEARLPSPPRGEGGKRLPSPLGGEGSGVRGPAGGLSAIYYFYDPRQRQCSLGTWNVLCLIDEAARRRLPYVYLGYYVEGCPSMSYKPRFVPNQLRGGDGVWRDFRT